MLEARALTKRYGALTVNDAIGFSLTKGEALGVLGPNGAGKTTLLKMLAGSVAPTEGKVLYQGRDITALPEPHRCRTGIVRTSQVPQPFEQISVWENVLTAASHGGGLHGHVAEDAAYTALKRTGLLDRHAKSAGSLSLMGRKRLELSRALACDPKVLLLDEIAGGLSDFEVHDLVALIKEIHASGVSIIWIEHVVHALVAVVDRLIALDFGELIAEGAPKEVMEGEAFKRAYFGEDHGLGEVM
ncbi:ATP-binding cassette domain-containing protein [Celeribacter sp. HF31]|uniref:ABC transporter ATP-binding protein n=1 Tax=Celeribacter sp. HF31 TaxID=2721558 RepID=UPI001430F3E1|nr:ATP-binding cassette domain-containing protein [Celeribacter sp. HF31]